VKWLDHQGRMWREPTTRGPLTPYLVPSHRALRAFTFHRDGYRCRHCGDHATAVPNAYDGSLALYTAGGTFLVVDHIVSRRNGGRHHPSNTQTLCDRCNARKANLVDRIGAPAPLEAQS
jgi:5-methylcytosine-specific restriction endonuclease McrA